MCTYTLLSLDGENEKNAKTNHSFSFPPSRSRSFPGKRPLTEEIRLKTCASLDYTVFPYNQGTPVYSQGNLFEILGTPMNAAHGGDQT